MVDSLSIANAHSYGYDELYCVNDKLKSIFRGENDVGDFASG